MQKSKVDAKVLTLGAILTALVIILQLLGSFIRFGTFSVSLVLIPIVIGAYVGGARMGAWLGFVFGSTVLLSGDAALFLGINVPATVLIVLVKGIAAGYCAGLVYKALKKFNQYLAVIASAVVCPVVNTGVFFLGCLIFFKNSPEIAKLATNAGLGGQIVLFIIVGFIGFNFLFELGFNMVLSPVIMRILKLTKIDRFTNK